MERPNNNSDKVQSYFFLAFLFFSGILFFFSIRTMIIDAVLALVIAHALYPLYRFLVRRLKIKREIASFLSIGAFVLIVTIPSYFLARSLYEESININFNQIWKSVSSNIANNSYFQRFKESSSYSFGFDVNDLKSFFSNIVSTVSNFSGRLFQQTTSTIFSILITLYLVFYILLEWRSFTAKFIELSPLSTRDEKEFIRRVGHTIDAVLLGTFFVAIMEGLYGMFLFMFLDIRAPIFWGFIMFVFSLLPIIGVNSVFVPVLIYHLIIGDFYTASIVLVFGVGGIAISQYVIKMKIMGKRASIHPTIIVLSTLGGLFWLGASGILVGPIIASIFLVALGQYGRRFPYGNGNNRPLDKKDK